MATSRLSKRTKGILKGAKGKGEQKSARVKASTIKELRKELRSPGVSKREKQLRNRVARKVKVSTTAGEAKGVRKALKGQAKRSALRKGR